MKVLPTSLLIFIASAVLAQVQPTNQQTFHISGHITQSGRPVPGVWVTFSGATHKPVKADDSGFYQTDLQVGTWRVFASGFSEKEHFELSRPRLFRVTEASAVVLDVFVRPAVGCGGVLILTPGGRQPTQEEVEQKNESCAGQEFFPAPSNDGVPFEVIIGGLAHDLCSTTRENQPACKPEFGAFNLLAVKADTVVFTPTPNGGLLEARGGVLVNDGHRRYRRDSIRFLIAGGQAVEAY